VARALHGKYLMLRPPLSSAAPRVWPRPPVAEGGTKPESAMTFTLKTSPVVTLAHWIRVSTQALADIGTLQTHIDTRLRYGLNFVEELQLLKGSGIGVNLNGLLTAATAYSGTIGSRLDTFIGAITQLALSDFVASGIVLHPSTWADIVRMKNTQGEYLLSDPAQMTAPRIWGLPVVVTAAMNDEQFLVGDFQQAAILYDRMQARVDISTETDDDFVTNRAHIKAEERLALAILRPLALIKGLFGS
jgi:HK97 family phage major capsid protein